MKVTNLKSTRNNAVPNQLLIEGNGIVTFQSYDSEIVAVNDAEKTITFFPDYAYGATTGKYRNAVLRDAGFPISSTADVKAAIKRGKCTRDDGEIFTVVLMGTKENPLTKEHFDNWGRTDAFGRKSFPIGTVFADDCITDDCCFDNGASVTIVRKAS